jgi:hypothetical protein
MIAIITAVAGALLILAAADRRKRVPVPVRERRR